MKPYDIGYYQSYDPKFGPPLVVGPVGIGFNTINRLNNKTGEIRQYSAGPGTTVQEHIHIAAKEPGHEGWLLFIVDQHESHHTEAHLLEAEHPEKGAIARIMIPYRLRSQVHGTWVPEELVR
jgi:carotenoid cleavage dioxygenase